MQLSPPVREQSGIWWDRGCLSSSSCPVCTLSHSGDHCSVHCSASLLVAPTFPLVTDNTCTVTSASHHRTHRATCSCTRNRNAKLHCAGGSPVSHLPASHLRLFALSLAIIFPIALPPQVFSSWIQPMLRASILSGLQFYQGFNSIRGLDSRTYSTQASTSLLSYSVNQPTQDSQVCNFSFNFKCVFGSTVKMFINVWTGKNGLS